eukprot:3374865-Prymnesium_polylepis.1
MEPGLELPKAAASLGGANGGGADARGLALEHQAAVPSWHESGDAVAVVDVECAEGLDFAFTEQPGATDAPGDLLPEMEGMWCQPDHTPSGNTLITLDAPSFQSAARADNEPSQLALAHQVSMAKTEVEQAAAV